LLDLRDITPVADYFVICSVDSERQARTLMEILVHDLKEEKQRPLSTEGEAASGWLLADYNTVVVHIFTRDARAFYRLDELWSAAPVVVRIQ
jgi:ribosome-associated protein